MINKTISLLQNCPNVVSIPQADVDKYKVDDDTAQQFYEAVKLFSKKAKNHLTFQYVKFHLDNNFKYLDIVKLPKYPFFAVYNKNTKRCLVNMGPALKTKIENIDPRDLYTMVCYAHVCSCLSVNEINQNYYEPFCQFMCLVLLKIFAKKYGITGSYVDLIPQFKFIVSLYVLMKFFGFRFVDANKKAKAFSKFDSNLIFKKVNIDNYDMTNIRDMVRLLSDSGVCPGITLYRFLESVLRVFGVMNLAFFEDIMRFCCAMFCCTINEQPYFPQILQIVYSQKDFEKIIQIIEQKL